jgi:hypothetical protein
MRLYLEGLDREVIGREGRRARGEGGRMGGEGTHTTNAQPRVKVSHIVVGSSE